MDPFEKADSRQVKLKDELLELLADHNLDLNAVDRGGRHRFLVLNFISRPIQPGPAQIQQRICTRAVPYATFVYSSDHRH